ncbi:DUF3558 family protein [Actinoalloteichus caeruleus]|uniref:DUF3558 family protein n=1 Tax=Actinoalloteichus caeruleus DSM 43889 TaxID=1120930 RepID=A0ABT1JEU7_ACTCY|nr:DUF3558 family protein [Actinoalloteichus caeruleus]MCP2331020.1 Protein of unknown function (DUF3558) [Actinoalloteichus caeruleus DSM 43889]
MLRIGPASRWAVVALAACTASACAQESAGRAIDSTDIPENTVGTGTPPTSSRPPGDTAPGDVGAELEATHPCEVLPEHEVTALGFDPESAHFDDFGIIYSCWYEPLPTGQGNLTLQLDANKGVDTINLTGFSANEIQVGSLRALRITDDLDPRVCQVALALDEEVHVSVMVSFVEDTEEACRLAEAAGALAEQYLPSAR